MLGTPSILSIVEAITSANIKVANPSSWSVFPVNLAERICNSFEECLVPLYEYLFTRLGICLPFLDFEVFVMDRLKVVPSQFHPGN